MVIQLASSFETPARKSAVADLRHEYTDLG